MELAKYLVGKFGNDDENDDDSDDDNISGHPSSRRLTKNDTPKPRGALRRTNKIRAFQGGVRESFPAFAKTREEKENAALIVSLEIPENYSKDEWFADHVVNFYNDIFDAYDGVRDIVMETFVHQGQGYPIGRAPYRWREDVDQDFEVLPSPIYVERTLRLLLNLVEDPQIFPRENDQNMMVYDVNIFLDDIAPMIFRRLFHMYTILISRYKEYMISLGSKGEELKNLLEGSFKHFMFFVFHYELLPNFFFVDVYDTEIPRYSKTRTEVDDLITDYDDQYTKMQTEFERNLS